MLAAADPPSSRRLDNPQENCNMQSLADSDPHPATHKNDPMLIAKPSRAVDRRPFAADQKEEIINSTC
jgi:hypothetical protein